MKWLIIILVLIAAIGMGFGLVWASESFEDDDEKD